MPGHELAGTLARFVSTGLRFIGLKLQLLGVVGRFVEGELRLVVDRALFFGFGLGFLDGGGEAGDQAANLGDLRLLLVHVVAGGKNVVPARVGVGARRLVGGGDAGRQQHEAGGDGGHGRERAGSPQTRPSIRGCRGRGSPEPCEIFAHVSVPIPVRMRYVTFSPRAPLITVPTDARIG